MTQAGVSGEASIRAITASIPNLLLWKQAPAPPKNKCTVSSANLGTAAGFPMTHDYNNKTLFLRHVVTLLCCVSAHQYSVKRRRRSSALNVAQYRQSGIVAQPFDHQLKRQTCFSDFSVHSAGNQKRTKRRSESLCKHLKTHIFHISGGDGLAIHVDGSFCNNYDVEPRPGCTALEVNKRYKIKPVWQHCFVPERPSEGVLHPQLALTNTRPFKSVSNILFLQRDEGGQGIKRGYNRKIRPPSSRPSLPLSCFTDIYRPNCLSVVIPLPAGCTCGLPIPP